MVMNEIKKVVKYLKDLFSPNKRTRPHYLPHLHKRPSRPTGRCCLPFNTESSAITTSKETRNQSNKTHCLVLSQQVIPTISSKPRIKIDLQGNSAVYIQRSTEKMDPKIFEERSLETFIDLADSENLTDWREAAEFVQFPDFLSQVEIQDIPLACLEEIHKHQPQTDIFTEVKTYQITYKDARNLLTGSWINDQIINAYIQLLDVKEDYYVFNTYFFGLLHGMLDNWNQIKVERLLKRQNLTQLSDKKFLVFPINLDNLHWVCAVISNEQNTITYYDSIATSGRDRVWNVLHLLVENCLGQSYEHMMGECPKQYNLNDCGVFALKTIACIVNEEVFNFCSNGMANTRKLMTLELKMNKLLK